MAWENWIVCHSENSWSDMISASCATEMPIMRWVGVDDWLSLRIQHLR
jgi:hypothetical protein